MIYKVEMWKTKENCFCHAEWCKNAKAADHFARGFAIEHNSETRIIHKGAIIAEYSGQTLKKKPC